MLTLLVSLALAQAPPVTRPKAALHGYEPAAARAIREQRPLVVGVGCAPPSDTRWLMAIEKKLDGYDAPCIVVACAVGKSLVWVETLPPTADAAAIARALAAWGELRPVTEARRPAPRQSPPMMIRSVVRGGNC